MLTQTSAFHPVQPFDISLAPFSSVKVIPQNRRLLPNPPQQHPPNLGFSFPFDLTAVRMLLEYKGDANRPDNLIHSVVRTRNQTIIELLLENGVDINRQIAIGRYENWSVLAQAVTLLDLPEDKDFISFLLERGADSNVILKESWKSKRIYSTILGIAIGKKRPSANFVGELGQSQRRR
jgi:hypothetical protein